MAKDKGKGRHDRSERLKKLAEEEKNQPTEALSDSAEVDDETMSGNPSDADSAAEGIQATAVIPEAPLSGETAAIAQADLTSIMDPVASPSVGSLIESPSADNHDDSMAGFDIDASGYRLDMTDAETGSFVAADFSEIPVQRKHQSLRVFGITLGVVIGLLLVAYIAGAVMFMGRFVPNTFIEDLDISMKTDDEVIELLDNNIAAYQLDVVGNGFSYHTTSADIGLDIDAAGIVRSMHDDLDEWSWPLLLLNQSHDESERLVITYKRDDLEKSVGKKVKKFNKDARAPANAYIAYDNKKDKYTVHAEEAGEQLDADAVKASVVDAVANLQPSLTLTDDHLLKPTVYSTDEKLIESAQLASGMVSARVTLSLNGQTVKEIDGSKLSDFISIGDDFSVKFDDKALDAWVSELTDGFDTIGTERHYTRVDGKAITVKGGSYGWEVDSEETKTAILNAIKEGEKTTIDIPCISTAATYSAAGERDWGNRYIDVDLSEQHVRFYGDDGKVFWETDCISGSPDGKHNTWEGVWYVNNKESPSTLIGYTDSGKKEYETKVTYWMPFEGNGIGFHDASWQPDFGGEMYREGYGSHGCVNLSPSAAKELYSIIAIGDVVVVHS